MTKINFKNIKPHIGSVVTVDKKQPMRPGRYRSR